MITIGKLKRNRRDDTLPITIITVFRTHTHLLLFEVACCWLVNTNCLCLFGQTEFVCYVYNFNLVVLRSIQNWLSTECQPNTLLFFQKVKIDWFWLIDARSRAFFVVNGMEWFCMINLTHFLYWVRQPSEYSEIKFFDIFFWMCL